MTQKAKAAKDDAFAMTAMEMPDAVREAAEKTVKQAKEGYEKLKAAAEDTTDAMEDTYETARDGIVTFNLKALEAAKANTDAAFDFAAKLFGAKSVSEAIELQSSFVRERFDAFSAQAKDMQDLFTKVASDTAKPTKDIFEKTMKEFKAA